jgi:hypothetical protein
LLFNPCLRFSFLTLFTQVSVYLFRKFTYINPVDMHKEQSLLSFSLGNFHKQIFTFNELLFLSDSLAMSEPANSNSSRKYTMSMYMYIYQVSLFVVYNRCSLNVFSFLSFLRAQCASLKQKNIFFFLFVYSFKSLDLSAG